MSVSGTYTFTVTRDDIIRDAMLNIGKLGQSESPTAQETTDCARKLNMMIKQWMGRIDFAPGLKVWTRKRGDLFLSSTHYMYSLGPTGDQWAGGIAVAQPNGANYAQTQITAVAVAGQSFFSVTNAAAANMTVNDYFVIQLDSGDVATGTIGQIAAGPPGLSIIRPVPVTTYSLPSQASAGSYVWNYTTKAQRPLEIQTAILRDAQNNDTPMNYMTLETYEQLPSKTMPTFLSDPTAIYYEAGIGSSTSTSNGTLYIDCGGAQDVTKHLHIVFLEPIMDFSNPTDNPEYPQEWYRALCWGLSREICPMFNAPWTKEMDGNFQDAITLAQHSNAETTQIYFQPYSASPYEP